MVLQMNRNGVLKAQVSPVCPTRGRNLCQQKIDMSCTISSRNLWQQKIQNSKRIKTFLWISIITCLIFIFTSCKAQSNIKKSNLDRKELVLDNSEVRYIYQEAVKRLLFESISFLPLEDLAGFYEFDSINCTNKNLEILISNKMDNKYLSDCLNFNKIHIKKEIQTNKTVKDMDFNLQPKIYSETIFDSKFSFEPPVVGFIKFSDIVVSNENNFYLSTILINRLSCFKFDQSLFWETSYTFEIERCPSGFLRFKRIIAGVGKSMSSHGPISTIKILNDTRACK